MHGTNKIYSKSNNRPILNMDFLIVKYETKIKLENNKLEPQLKHLQNISATTQVP